MKKNRIVRAREFLALRKLLKVMRISMFILLVTALQSLAINSYSQQAKLSLRMKNVRLEQVMDEIENRSDFYFLFNQKLVDIDRTVNVNVQAKEINAILDQLFVDTNIRYMVLDKQIVLSVSQTNAAANRQVERVIKGTVIDEEGEALPGVSVVVKGTSLGVTTSIDGKYEINVPAGYNVITFSFVGMATQDIELEEKTTIDVILQADAIGLEEVVAVGYGVQKKVNLTGAVSAVDSKVLESRPITSVGQGLQGAIPNLNISVSNGSPGSSPSFNVRGGTTINGGDPLILVDGVQMDPNLINPNDIENVSVLKDAASAAIYGARAAFGVILITTKSGKKGQKAHFSYNGNVSFNKPTKLPEYVNSLDYVNMMNIASTNAGSGIYFNDDYVAHVKNYLNNPTPENAVFIDPNNSNKYLYCGNTDWIDVIYKDYTTIHNHTFNLNGGTAKTSYYTSFGVMDQTGLNSFFDEKYQRYNASLNVKTDVTDWVTFHAKTRFNHTKEKSPYGSRWMDGSTSGFMSGDLRPLMPVYHPDGNFSGQGSWTNQAALAQLSGTRNRKINDLWLTAGATVKPFEGMTINMDYSFNFYSNVHEVHRKEIKEYYANPDMVTLYPWTKPSSASLSQSDDYYNALNIYGQYEKIIDNHDLKLLVGFNQEEKSNRYYSASRDKLINNDLGVINQAIGERSVGESKGDWAIRGAFYRLNYIFADKYLVELNGRYDGSSKFPKDDRFEFFPSVSLGWRISKEEFFENLNTGISDLKLRGSYGSLGNQNVNSNYPYIATLGSNSETGYIINGSLPVSINPAGLVSADLTWESVSQIDFGFDLAMFESRFTASFDWYKRETKDMLTSGQPLPAILGTGVPNENAADLETKGWELTLGWKDRINSDLRYDVSFVLSDNQTEITKYDNPNGLLNRYYEGRKFGEIWGFETIGLFQSDEAVAAAPSQSQIWGGQWAAGDVQYADLDGDKEITWGQSTLDDLGDRKIIGNSTPRYRFGLRGNIEYKNFDLNFFFQGVGKRDYMPGGNYFWGLTNEWMVPQQHSLDYWTPDNTDAYWFRPRFGHGGNYQTQTKYLQDASYIRLKQLSIGYEMPKTLIRKAGLEKVRIYVSGENLWEYSNLLDAYDPEVLNATDYPIQRSVSVGLNITL